MKQGGQQLKSNPFYSCSVDFQKKCRLLFVPSELWEKNTFVSRSSLQEEGWGGHSSFWLWCFVVWSCQPRVAGAETSEHQRDHVRTDLYILDFNLPIYFVAQWPEKGNAEWLRFAFCNREGWESKSADEGLRLVCLWCEEGLPGWMGEVLRTEELLCVVAALPKSDLWKTLKPYSCISEAWWCASISHCGWSC